MLGEWPAATAARAAIGQSRARDQRLLAPSPIPDGPRRRHAETPDNRLDLSLLCVFDQFLKWSEMKTCEYTTKNSIAKHFRYSIKVRIVTREFGRCGDVSFHLTAKSLRFTMDCQSLLLLRVLGNPIISWPEQQVSSRGFERICPVATLDGQYASAVPRRDESGRIYLYDLRIWEKLSSKIPVGISEMLI